MLQAIAGMVIVLLCVIGVVSFIKWVVLRVAAPCSNDTRIYCVILKGDSADIELQLAVDTLNWDSGFANVRAYAVDCGIDSACLTSCEQICANSRFRLVTPERLFDVLKMYRN